MGGGKFFEGKSVSWGEATASGASVDYHVPDPVPRGLVTMDGEGDRGPVPPPPERPPRPQERAPPEGYPSPGPNFLPRYPHLL